MQYIIYMDDIEKKCIYEMLEYANRVQGEMKRSAKKSFSRGVASQYIRGLSEPTVLEREYEIMFSLNGWLPVALEDGVDTFDMKPGLLGSPKAKISKAGDRYMNIPVFKAAFKNPYLTAAKVSPFRTVSDKSKPDSWIHPGLMSRNLFGKAILKVS